MKKGYPYSYDVTSAVYGYEICTTHFDKMLNGNTNVYQTRVHDVSKGYESLVIRYNDTKECAEKCHIEELNNCLLGKYDNYEILSCENCQGNGHIHKDGNWLNSEDDNLETCPVCKGEAYKVVIEN